MLRFPAASRFHQHGAIAIMSAVALSALLLFVALAVDTGRLYLAKRSLQQQADIAALQAAQVYCSGFDDIGTVEAATRSTLLNHGFDADDGANTMTVQLGTLSSNNNRHIFASTPDLQAIEVRLTRTIPAALFAGSVFNTATLAASAVAERDLIATLSAGSSLLNVDSEQSEILDAVLGAMLGTAVNLSLASYEGLLDGAVTFGQLITELSAAGLLAAGDGLDELSGLSLNVGELLTALGNTIANQGGPSSAIDALDELLNQAIAAGSDAAIIDLSTILVSDDYVGDQQALASRVTPLHFIVAALMAGNEGESLVLNLAIDTSAIPLLDAAPSITLTIHNAPAIAVGRFGYDGDGDPHTEAIAANISLTADIPLNVNLALANIGGSVSISVSTAESSAWLDQVTQCPRLLSRSIDFSVQTATEIADVDLASNIDVSLLAFPLIDVGADAQVSLGGVDTDPIIFSVDLSQADPFPTERKGDNTALSDALYNDLEVNLTVESGLSPLIAALVNPIIAALLNPLSDALNQILGGVALQVLEPVMDALGLSLGEVTVQILDLEEGQGELML